MPIHEMTDEERYLAPPRHGQLALTTTGWVLGGLTAALLVTLPSPLQDQALTLYTDTFGAPKPVDGVVPGPAVNTQGVVVFGLAGLMVGFVSSFLTDLLYGIPKIHLRWSVPPLILLWGGALGAFALVGFPFAAPLVGGLMGWLRAAGFSGFGRRVQAIVWVVVTGLMCAALGVLMVLRPDLGTVVRFS